MYRFESPHSGRDRCEQDHPRDCVVWGEDQSPEHQRASERVEIDRKGGAAKKQNSTFLPTCRTVRGVEGMKKDRRLGWGHRKKRVASRRESRARHCPWVSEGEHPQGPLGFVVKALVTLRAQGQESNGVRTRLQSCRGKPYWWRGRETGRVSCRRMWDPGGLCFSFHVKYL